MTPDQRPRCPHCGEPARSITMMARVECELHDDGTPGKVLRATRRDASEVEYRCGGRHTWTT